jgi:general secretion pathway protein G
MRVGHSSASSSEGYTLLEIMIVVLIFSIIASIGVPQYVAALQTARVGKAKHDLVTISNAIGSYTANNDGKLPWSLFQVGYGGKQDPWGATYCYLNYADGTGDGLEWAIAAGLVDPSAFQLVATGGSGGGGGDGGASVLAWDRWHEGDTSGAGASPQVQGESGGSESGGTESGGSTRSGDIGGSGVDGSASGSGSSSSPNYDELTILIGRDITLAERQALELILMTSGNFSIFAGVPIPSTRRLDTFMLPLNTDYDLFSLGPNKSTSVSLRADVALDDVIRANNGGFFGVAADY